MKTKSIFLAVMFAVPVLCPAQFKVFDTGNVGVRMTSNPWANFHVVGNSTFTGKDTVIISAPYIRGNQRYSTPITPDFTWWGNDQCGIFHPAPNIIGFSTNGTERIRLTQNGNLLIGGTWDGGAKLSIDAKERCNQINYSNLSSDWGWAQVSNVNRQYTKSWVVSYNWLERFAVWGNGIVYGYGGFYSGCDSIFKENIDTINDPLGKLLLLKGIKYNDRQEILQTGDTITVLPTDTPKTKFGVIAQEVEAVVPEAVITLPDGTKAVSYETLLALLIESSKKQQKIIENQSNTIISLQNEIISINERLILAEECLNNLPHGLGCSHQHNKSLNNNSPEYNTDSAKLFQNIPNPFNVKTVIGYYLPNETTNASLLIFDMQGKLIKIYKIATFGKDNIEINAGELQPGMYMYSLIANGKEVDTKKMILTE
ncbi:MAG: hypothetical protein COX07_02630 [Bacteroidetes bacterium CG23_combo_of_CG06-09_8_20_14_all_32_9]|nr:MAG: hypothetical protein COX07_02630 [Bacteroidetes bacterium CG23_combo_of_CG06-09_8_20_14_all_32_9]